MPYDDLWEGRSPNAADAYRRMSEAGEAPDNSWLSRLFGQRREAAGPPAPSPVPSDEGRFAGASPFSPPPPAPKPASKLTSASDIAKRISSMIGAANEPTPVLNADFGLPPSEYGHSDADPLAAALNQIPNAAEPPPPRVPIDMRENSSPFASASLAGLPDSIKQAVAELLGGGNKFGGNKFGGQRFGGNTYGGNVFGGNRFGAGAYASGGSIPGYAVGGFPDDVPGPDELPHMAGLPKQVVQNNPQTPPPIPAPPPPVAGGGGGSGGGGGGFGDIAKLAMTFLPMLLKDGGSVPGFMRGGYPELRTAPIRRFDSGGQSYVETGNSSGRADDVDARLSPKEYVVDAETMSMLGDGNPDHGAKKMDQFRSNVRRHKGKALAKGRFSPNAKNPAEYLTSSPISDGIRRLGRNK